MTRRFPNSPALHWAALLALVTATPALAYQLTPEEYAEITTLPAWDNEGHLPEGDSRVSELQWIANDLEERQQILDVRAYMVKRMLAVTRDPKRAQSLQKDYESQLVSFARWRESMDRRREAIMASYVAPPEPAADAKPTTPTVTFKP